MTRLVLTFLVVAACGGGGGGAPDTAVSLTCQQLSDQWDVAIASVDRACDSVADCRAPGGPIEDTCNCTPALGEHAVNADAYAGSAAETIAAQFRDQCADDPGAPAVCDAAPSTLSCVNHVCAASPVSCFDVDAGP